MKCIKINNINLVGVISWIRHARSVHSVKFRQVNSITTRLPDPSGPGCYRINPGRWEMRGGQSKASFRLIHSVCRGSWGLREMSIDLAKSISWWLMHCCTTTWDGRICVHYCMSESKSGQWSTNLSSLPTICTHLTCLVFNLLWFFSPLHILITHHIKMLDI